MQQARHLANDGKSPAEARPFRSLRADRDPNSVLDMKLAKAIHAANYGNDARLARMLSFATIIAMVIAAFGV